MGLALKRAGFSVVEFRAPDRMARLCDALDPESLDCYVQLAGDVGTSAAGAVEQLADCLTQGLLRRVDAAAAVLPLLRPQARVVLVAEHRLSASGTPEDFRGGDHWLSVLAAAIESEKGATGVRAVVADARCSAEDLAETVTSPPQAAWSISEFAAAWEELSFADWKQEIVRLWSRPEGRWVSPVS